MPGGKLPEIFISTREAGELLGCGPQSIETGLRNGSFPIGWSWLTEEEGKRGQWNYRIPRQAFYRAIEDGSLPGPSEERGTYTECRLYRIWVEMTRKCRNHNHREYIFYGGRGIDYVFDWERYPDFEKWAYENGYREYYTLERRNKSLGFSPENCRWAEKQTRKKRSVTSEDEDCAV